TAAELAENAREVAHVAVADRRRHLADAAVAKQQQAAGFLDAKTVKVIPQRDAGVQLEYAAQIAAADADAVAQLDQREGARVVLLDVGGRALDQQAGWLGQRPSICQHTLNLGGAFQVREQSLRL